MEICRGTQECHTCFTIHFMFGYVRFLVSHCIGFLGMILRITTERYTICTICFVDSRDDDDDDVFTDEAPSSSYEQSAEALSKSAKQRSQSLSALPKDDKSPKKVGAARVHAHTHTHNEFITERVCIPVGGVLPASMAATRCQLWVVSVQGVSV